MENWTVRQKIGQRLIVGFDGPELSPEFIELVREYKAGNVILFKHNIQSAPQLKKLCGEIQELVQQQTGIPAFITIDQEGGMVTRLSQDASHIPGAMAIASTGCVENAYVAGHITGLELRAMGVNFDLAPNMDINSNANNPVIGVRSYGDTPDTVSRYGLEMFRGLADAGVASAAKHFPGHGDTSVDSHVSLPVVDKSLAELEENELRPFAAAIAAGIPAVMSSHILFPQLEPEKKPATMSRKIITELLKEHMGFRGLVISDCMEMNAIQRFYGTVNGIIGAMKAGVDMVFVSHTPSLAAQAVAVIEKELESGRMDTAEMDASVERILDYKKRYVPMDPFPLEVVGCTAHKQAVQEMMDQALTLVGGKLRPLGKNPWFAAPYAFRVTLASNLEDKDLSFAEYLAEQLGGEGTNLPPNPADEEIEKLRRRAAGHSSIVVGTYNGRLHQGQIKLIRVLAKTGIPVTAIALRDPYDLALLPEQVCRLAAFEYTPLSLDAVARFLRGELVPGGRLSVHL